MAKESLAYLDFVHLVLEVLEEAGVPYLIGGAVAAWAWGEPRATRDLDLVVRIPGDAVKQLSGEFQKRAMQLPPDIIQSRLEDDRGDVPLTVVHAATGYKADLYLVRDEDSFRAEAFQRRIQVDLGPELGEVYLHTPEDLILNKLMYYGMSQQSKHLRDITAIVKTLGDDLDVEYLQHWVDEKGLHTLWENLQRRIQEVE
ncbi:MAG: nucleotidyltransferase [Anaerolineales bacterium]